MLLSARVTLFMGIIRLRISTEFFRSKSGLRPDQPAFLTERSSAENRLERGTVKKMAAMGRTGADGMYSHTAVLCRCRGCAATEQTVPQMNRSWRGETGGVHR